MPRFASAAASQSEAIAFISALTRRLITAYAAISQAGLTSMAERIEIPAVAGCTCMRLRRASRRITQIYDELLAPAGLTVTQFGLLANLRACALSIGALASRLGMDPTTLTRNLRPLQARGLAEIGAAE